MRAQRKTKRKKKGENKCIEWKWYNEPKCTTIHTPAQHQRKQANKETTPAVLHGSPAANARSRRANGNQLRLYKPQKKKSVKDSRANLRHVTFEPIVSLFCIFCAKKKMAPKNTLVFTHATTPNGIVDAAVVSAACDAAGLRKVDVVGVVVEVGIHTISQRAFYDPTDMFINLTSVRLRPGLLRIGNEAFRGLSIGTMDIPDSVTHIGWSALEDCASLRVLRFPRNLAAIPPSVCAGCRLLWKVILNDQAIEVGARAFYRCSALRLVEGGSNLREVEAYAFMHCRALGEFGIPDGVHTIGEQVFAFSGLKALTIPDSVRDLGAMVADSCGDLKEVHVGDGVSLINTHSFAQCPKLQYVTGCANVQVVASWAFSFCSSLRNFVMPQCIAIDNRACMECRELRMVCFSAGLQHIGPSVFLNCELLRHLFLAPSLAQVSKDVVEALFAHPDAGHDTFDIGEMEQRAPAATVARVYADDAAVAALTGPYADYAALADVPRSLRAAPDASTWAAVQLHLWWSKVTDAGYIDKSRVVAMCRKRLLFVTMLSAARTCRVPSLQRTRTATAKQMTVAPQHRLSYLPEELWVIIFTFVRHGRIPLYC